MTTALDILRAVSEESGVDMPALLNGDRHWAVAWPRQLAMLLIRTRAGYSLPRAGRVMGKHHTTILQGCRAASDRLLAVPAYRALHERVVARLDGTT